MKKIFSLFISAIVSISLIACGNDEPEPEISLRLSTLPLNQPTSRVLDLQAGMSTVPISRHGLKI